VVIARIDRPGGVAVLRRFAAALAGVSTALMLAMALTPLGALWFERVSALPPALAGLALGALWLTVPWPALTVYQCWFQGAIVHSRKTRAVTESVALSLAASGLVLG